MHGHGNVWSVDLRDEEYDVLALLNNTQTMIAGIVYEPDKNPEI